MKTSIAYFKLFCLIFGFIYSFDGFSQTNEANQEQGKASFYSSKFEGRKTANGEIFNNSDFTAAHKTLPFNSLVRITNPENQKTIVVRINDRGPHIKGRVIDLTIAAAKKIGLDIKGAIPVVILVPETTLLTFEIDSTFSAHRYSDCLGNEAEPKKFTLVLWKTKNLQHMLYVANDLDDSGKPGATLIERKLNQYYLLITGFQDKKTAEEAIIKYKRQGFLNTRLYVKK